MLVDWKQWFLLSSMVVEYGMGHDIIIETMVSEMVYRMVIGMFDDLMMKMAKYQNDWQHEGWHGW